MDRSRPTGARENGGDELQKGTSEGVTQNNLRRDCSGGYMTVYFSWTQTIIYPKRVNFCLCKLHLNKTDHKKKKKKLNQLDFNQATRQFYKTNWDDAIHWSTSWSLPALPLCPMSQRHPSNLTNPSNNPAAPFVLYFRNAF